MLQIKKRGLSSSSNSIFTYAEFAYNEGPAEPSEFVSACGLSPSVFLYRNSLGENFIEATLLAEDEDFITLAPSGAYSEFDITEGAVVSRYWSGTSFATLVEVCG